MNIEELIIGINHKEKFEILDNWGKIVDKIIGNNPYFDSKYFPNISQTYTTERMLGNNETENYLRVTPHDIIYRHKIEGKAFDEEYKLFCDRILNNIIPNIINECNVNNFVRIGIVFNIRLENKDQYSNLIKKIVNPHMNDVNDIRFSQKSPTQAGKIFGNINDYINKIYTISIRNDKYILVYDYQYYFNPIKEDFRQCDLGKILEKAKNEMENNITDLLGELDEKKQ